MREILFRGKRTDNGEWAYGYYSAEEFNVLTYEIDKIPRIQQLGSTGCYGVKSDTVGQYTGLTDKNGMKIFEGDIVVWDYDEVDSDGSTHSTPEVVRWDTDTCGFAVNDDKIDKECRVIGNVHDNPELLGGEKNDS